MIHLKVKALGMGEWAICIFLPIGKVLNLKQNQESTEIKVKEADEYGVKALGMGEWAIPYSSAYRQDS